MVVGLRIGKHSNKGEGYTPAVLLAGFWIP